MLKIKQKQKRNKNLQQIGTFNPVFELNGSSMGEQYLLCKTLLPHVVDDAKTKKFVFM